MQHETLFSYFEKNWEESPHPVIDHALRIMRQPDGTFTFYIHPAYQSGTTMDFVVANNGSTAAARAAVTQPTDSREL